MKKYVFLSLFYFLTGCGALISLSGCGKGGAGSNRSALPGTNTPVKLYIYGDQFSGAGTYPELLAQRQGWAIVNKSVASSTITSANQYAAIMADTWESNSVVFWAPGTNEAMVSGAANATYINDYEAVMVRLKTLKQKAILGGPLPSCNGTTSINSSNFWTNNITAAWTAIDPGFSVYTLVEYRPGSSTPYATPHSNPGGYPNNMSAPTYLTIWTPAVATTSADCTTPLAAQQTTMLNDLLNMWDYNIATWGSGYWTVGVTMGFVY